MTYKINIMIFNSKEEIQESDNYKSLNSYLATGYAEGFEDTDEFADIQAAWQYLYDTGLTNSLQGWFGREAERLINEGIIFK